jgi:hypothetical protein
MMRRAGWTNLGLLPLMLEPACLASAAPGGGWLQDSPTWLGNRFIDAVPVDSAGTSRGAGFFPEALPQR